MTLSVPDTVVVVDTDVFSQVYVGTHGPNYLPLRHRLVGCIPVVATQTVAELRFGARLARWGTRRLADLDRLLAETTVVPVTPEVVDAFVELQLACHTTGHALHQKAHTADRWIAATAMALGRPLVSLDTVYVGAPGLTTR